MTAARRISRRCRRRLSEGRSQDLVYFVFDLAVRMAAKICAPFRSPSARNALKRCWPKSQTSDNIRYVDHLAGAGDAVLQSACRMHLEGIISKRLSAPYRSGRTESWTKSKCRAGHEVVIGGWSGTRHQPALAHRWRVSRRSSGPCRPGRHRLQRAQRQGPAQAAEGQRHRQEPVRGQGCAAQTEGLELGQAGARRRDRVCRLDRRWHDPPVRLQGAARGQAGQGGARGAPVAPKRR